MPANAESVVGIVRSDGEALTTSAIMAEAVTGSHVLQIKGYSSTKGLGNGKCIKSSMFSVGGHHWFIKFYPDGDLLENADCISIFLQHDHTEAVDVNARYKFGVVDRSGESVPMFSLETYVDDTFSSQLPSSGFSRFVERKDLEESPYLKDDCLKVRCDIIISNDISTENTLQFVVVPPSNMHRHFGSLLSGGVGADITFEFAGEMFAAHRSVLAARSLVFMAELFGPMKEKTMNCIQIQAMEARVFKALLHFIYTDTMPEIDTEDDMEARVVTQNLLVAADRYDLERLRLICEERLCVCIDTSTVAMTMALAERHGCHGLKNACFQFLKFPSALDRAMATESFDHLMTTCPSLIKELLAEMATYPRCIHTLLPASPVIDRPEYGEGWE